MNSYLKTYLLFCCAYFEVAYVQPCLPRIQSNDIYVAGDVKTFRH
jgi:hypothetical protein